MRVKMGCQTRCRSQTVTARRRSHNFRGCPVSLVAAGNGVWKQPLTLFGKVKRQQIIAGEIQMHMLVKEIQSGNSVRRVLRQNPAASTK